MAQAKVDFNFTSPTNIGSLFDLATLQMNFDELKKIISGLLNNQIAQQHMITELQDKNKDLVGSKTENDVLTDRIIALEKELLDSKQSTEESIKSIFVDLDLLKGEITPPPTGTDPSTSKVNYKIKKMQSDMESVHQKSESAEELTRDMNQKLNLISSLAGEGGEAKMAELLKAIDITKALDHVKEDWRKDFATKNEHTRANRQLNRKLEKVIECIASGEPLSASMLIDDDEEEIKEPIMSAGGTTQIQQEKPQVQVTQKRGDVGKRLDALEKEYKDCIHNDEFDELHNFVADIFEQLGQLKGEKLSESIGGKQKMQSTTSSKFMSNSRESKQIKELLERMTEIEARVTKMSKQVNNISDLKNLDYRQTKEQIIELQSNLDKKANTLDLKKLAPQLSKLLFKEGEIRDQLMEQAKSIETLNLINSSKERQQSEALINTRIDNIDIKITAMIKGALELKEKVNEVVSVQAFGGDKKTSVQSSRAQSAHSEEDKFMEIEESMKDLQKSLNAIKAGIQQNQREIQTRFDDCQKIENMKVFQSDMTEKIEGQVKELTKKCADKGETRRQFKNLEKNIKNVAAGVQSAPKQDQEEDAILAKKPIENWSCASCERKIKNYTPREEPFLPWKGLPFKAPSERISKYGQGFSRILQNIERQGGDIAILNKLNRNNSIVQSSIQLGPEDDLAEGSTMSHLQGLKDITGGAQSDDEKFKMMPHSKSVSYLTQTQPSYMNASMIRQEAKQTIQADAMSPNRNNQVSDEYLQGVTPAIAGMPAMRQPNRRPKFLVNKKKL